MHESTEKGRKSKKGRKGIRNTIVIPPAKIRSADASILKKSSS